MLNSDFFSCMKADDLTSPPHGVRGVLKPSKYWCEHWARPNPWERQTWNGLPACMLAFLYCLKMAINKYEEQCFSVSILNFSFCSWQPSFVASCSVFCLCSPAVSLRWLCEGVFRQGWNLRESKQWGARSSLPVFMMCDSGQLSPFQSRSTEKAGSKCWRRVQLRTLYCVVFFSFLWSSQHCCETFLVVWPLWQRDIFEWPLGSAGNEQWLGLIFSFSVHVFFLELVETLITFLNRKIEFLIEKSRLLE